jgi:hypothetical protein
MEPAFVIRGTRYPVVNDYRLGDPALVCEITGLEWAAFNDLLLNTDDDTPLDFRVQTAMIAVAVAHVHHTWSRDKILRFVSSIPFDEVELEGVEPETDPTPSTLNGSESGSSTPPEPVPESQAAPSRVTPTGSGSPGSGTTSPASLPAV